MGEGIRTERIKSWETEEVLGFAHVHWKNLCLKAREILLRAGRDYPRTKAQGSCSISLILETSYVDKGAQGNKISGRP